MVMGSYGVGIERLMACIVEQHNDAGLCWPKQSAPDDLSLVGLNDKHSPEVATHAGTLYQTLIEAGLKVLYDERLPSPGVKVNAADLIGLPIRVTVGKSGLARGLVDVKRRVSNERREVEGAALGDTLRCEEG